MLRPLAALALLAAAGAAGAEDIVILPTREGVTQSFLLSSPPAGKARAVAVLFPGGAGRVDLEREAARVLLDRGNYLVRSRRLFTGSGIVAAVMDAPSDHSSGMEDEFRLGAAHAEDVERVVADLQRRYPGLPVFLVGTSSGTISAASAARRLGSGIDGVVLSATVLVANRRRTGLSGFDFSTIAVPLLFVHHVEDGCNITPYSAAKRLADRYPVISVSGGPPTQSKPCEPMSAHGFLGREADTVDAIAKWMLKQPYPREIN
ncbi:MAG TPA: alpha/beta hydrolase [Burkholderiales bacterium]|nr:alpha/beta hydrolase [Burkholderiales bacterium]